MRVVLVGRPETRERLRPALRAVGWSIAGEFESLAAARRAGIQADAVLLADASSRQEDLATRAAPPVDPLTPREIEVLTLMADGLPNKAIAARLGISDQTVKFHVAAICGKLGARNRTGAVRLALAKGLIAI